MARWAVGILALAAACRPAKVAEPAACGRDDVLVLGACVRQTVAAKICGPAATWDPAAGACVARPCDAGHVRDELTGECLGELALRAIGERQHVTTDATHVLGCKKQQELHVAGGLARCLEPDIIPAVAPRACRPAEVWDGRACAPLGGASGIDVATWARAALGPMLCPQATRDPSAFDLLTGATTPLEADVELDFPDNDVTAVYARVVPRRPLGSAALSRVIAAVDANVELLRALGGTARAASYVQRISCTVRAGASPVALPTSPADENR